MNKYFVALHKGLCCGNWYTKLFRLVYQFPLFLIILSPVLGGLFFQVEIESFFNQFSLSRSIAGVIYFWCIGLGVVITLLGDRIESWENEIAYTLLNLDSTDELSEKEHQ